MKTDHEKDIEHLQLKIDIALNNIERNQFKIDLLEQEIKDLRKRLCVQKSRSTGQPAVTIAKEFGWEINFNEN
jgi:hypothetical protein